MRRVPWILALGVAVGAQSAGGGETPRGEVERVIEGDALVRLLPVDAIPAIDRPKLISASRAAKLLRDDAPVLGVFSAGVAHAYPTWHLDGHEIVNDRLGDLPIAATW